MKSCRRVLTGVAAGVLRVDGGPARPELHDDAVVAEGGRMVQGGAPVHVGRLDVAPRHTAQHPHHRRPPLLRRKVQRHAALRVARQDGAGVGGAQKLHHGEVAVVGCQVERRGVLEAGVAHVRGADAGLQAATGQGRMQRGGRDDGGLHPRLQQPAPPHRPERW